MGSKLENLIDPGWLIPAFLIGILSGFVVVYLKPIVDNLLSRLSSRYKAYRNKKKKEYDDEINKIAKDRTFLIITFIIAMLCAATWLGFTILFFVLNLTVMIETDKNHIVTATAAGIAAISSLFLTFAYLRRAQRAFYKYIKDKESKRNAAG